MDFSKVTDKFYDVESVSKVFHDIETNFDVSGITFQGISVWPLIRFYLMYAYYLDQPSVAPEFKSSLKSNLADLYYNYKGASARIKTLKDYDKLDREHEDESIKPVNSLVLFHNSSRLVEIEGKAYSPFFESIIDVIQQYGEAKILEYILDDYIYPRFSPTHNISILFQKALLKAVRKKNIDYVSGKYKGLKIKNYQNYLNFCKEQGFKITHSYEDLKHQLYILWEYKQVWLDLFEKYQPKVVFLGNFEQPILFMATLAANQLNIKTVEVQHGMIGMHHLTYAQRFNMPVGGYDMLPTHFWCWGSYYTSPIASWATKTTRHQTIIGGNAWINTWIRDKEVVKKYMQSYQAPFSDSSKPKILYSAQPHDGFFPDFLIQVMQETQHEFDWIIRLHPAMAEQLKEIEDELHKQNITNYHLHPPSEIPLFIILKKVQLNITISSTVAQEALAFKVPSIIINDYGRKNFEEDIKQKAFYYADNTKDLKNVLADFFDGRLEVNYEFANKYFLTDEKVINSELAGLYS